jgi:hypothetical protein
VCAGWLVVLVIFRVFKILINNSCTAGTMVQLSRLV